MVQQPKTRFNVDWVGKFKLWIIISVGLALLGVVAILVNGLSLSINFKGGSILTYSYTSEINLTEAETVVETALGQDVTVTTSSNFDGSSKNLVVTLAANDTLSTTAQADVTAALQTEYPDIKFADANSVSSKNGKAFFNKAMYALLLASIFVTLYVAVRFRRIGGLQAAITAILAMTHDMFLALFAYAAFGFAIDEIFVAVLLTIMAYSLNDTIVIYDRIRENEKLYGKNKTFREIVNLSINQTFTRTLMTSFCTFIASITICIIAFANNIDSIKSFGVAMAIGVVSGSYSTICLAGPIWVHWVEWREKRSKNKKSTPNNKSKTGNQKKKAIAKK